MSVIRILHLADLTTEYYQSYEEEQKRPFRNEREFFIKLMYNNQLKLTEEVVAKDPTFEPALEYTSRRNDRYRNGENIVNIMTDIFEYVSKYKDTLLYIPEYTVLLASYASYLFQFIDEGQEATLRYICLAEDTIGWKSLEKLSSATLGALISALYHGDYKGFQGAFRRCFEERRRPTGDKLKLEGLMNMADALNQAPVSTQNQLFGEIFVEDYVKFRYQRYKVPIKLRTDFISLIIDHNPSLAFHCSEFLSSDFMIDEMERLFVEATESQAMTLAQQTLPLCLRDLEMEKEKVSILANRPYETLLGLRLNFDRLREYLEVINLPGW